jgi:acyl transferase domain-containing protein
MKGGTNEPIAIIGTGCRFPGGSNTASKLWDLLKEPKDVSKEIPADRFNLDRFYHKDSSHHGTANVRRSYLLDEDVRLFDTQFFGISPGEAQAMDPQHRVLLEVVYEAIESAGQTIPGLQNSDTAVYVGLMCTDYYVIQAADLNSVPTYNATGVANSNASSRVSYFFNWHGPSMVSQLDNNPFTKRLPGYRLLTQLALQAWLLFMRPFRLCAMARPEWLLLAAQT